MKYKFVDNVTPAMFDVTKGAWLAQMEANAENVSEPYYNAALEYTERTAHGQLKMTDAGGCLCAVVEEGSEFASALLIVTHAKPKSEVRMMNVYVQPSLNLANVEKPDYAALAWIAATAIVGCLQLTYDRFPAKQLKIHTAIPLDAEFMSNVITTILLGMDSLSNLYDVSSHGNWLMVTKKDSDAKLKLVAN
ncbi:hypothetical protein [Stenotrophomonas maltophilia]|uniref:hypothetical protein n=1 Tax=Stenotrophomonas maltophilia TaxID=40324 RepID=UPI0016611FD2|nr:hypothetical protein [Stenotrophomonas maltophilia]